MAFSRHTSRIYMEPDDINGALNVLSRRIVANEDPEATDFYIGAHLALNLINNHEHIRTQADFIRMFDVQLYEHGKLETLEGKGIEEEL